MTLQKQGRKMARRTVFACLICLAAAAGLLCALCLRPGAPERLLGRTGEWALLRGAPALSGAEQTISRETLLRGKLLLISPAHPLPEDFPALNVRSIRALVGSYLPAEEGAILEREAVYALCALQLEHPLETGARIFRGALSNAQQEAERQAAFERFRAIRPLEEALRLARQAVPAAGESEHQGGYALDIRLTGTLNMGKIDPLLRNETGAWLAENAWRFGFLYRYGPGSAAEGACEEIHLRYVGRGHAAAMRAAGLGLEEYWALLRSERALTLTRDGEPWAYLYCAPCTGAWTLPLPADAAWEASADNTGWAVLLRAP